MATIALIVHEQRDDAEHAARELAAWLTAQGHDLVLLQDNAEQMSVVGERRSPEQFATGVSLVISLGGDGSMLRAAELASPHGVAVLGVDFGQLGYLTEVKPEGMTEAVRRVLDGACVIEERLRVVASVHRANGEVIEAGHALNEALVERDESGRTVRLGLSIDQSFFTTYNADGVIVASPTGSTAYSLSARGPIVAPLHQALIVTPVSPHQLFDRSLVLAPTSEVEIEVLPDRAASLSIDGRSIVRLQPGDRVVCTQSPLPARIVSLPNTDFLNVLKTKFGLNDR